MRSEHQSRAAGTVWECMVAAVFSIPAAHTQWSWGPLIALNAHYYAVGSRRGAYLWAITCQVVVGPVSWVVGKWASTSCVCSQGCQCLTVAVMTRPVSRVIRKRALPFVCVAGLLALPQGIETKNKYFTLLDVMIFIICIFYSMPCHHDKPIHYGYIMINYIY